MALSPLWQRRLHKFKGNRRGYWSFLVFMSLFVVSLFAELLANDKPIVLHYDGAYYFPAWKAYPETTFGGDLETETVYTDPFVAELLGKKESWAIWPPIRFHYSTIDFENTAPAPAPSNERHFLGTDDQGRDVMARILYGFRVSVLFGLVLTGISALIGIVAGAVQGYYGGWVDMIFQRVIEVLNSIPFLVLLITIASMVTPGFWTLMAIMVFVMWVYLVDVVRAECLKTRNQDYVRAARALGVKDSKILFRHVLPNAFVAGLTLIPIVLNISITSLTALDFLGFGLPPETASLGELLKQGKDNVHAPWLLMSGFVTLAVIMSLLVFIGEAVRDALDPRKAG
ncbi:MAG: ABC transporter permease [Alphaproteobacteria bacterium]|nr:ABC transporter permease [Alphaproteobacteria bacterium]